MNPWEKYAAQGATTPQGAPEVPPWEKYGAAAKAPATGLDALPPETSPGNQSTANNDDLAHRILGIGEAGLAAGSGAVAGAAGQVYGIGKTLASGKFGTQAGVQEGEKAGVDLASKLTYQPRTQTGKDLTETAGKAFEASRLQGLPVEGATLGRIPEVPRAALAAGEGAAGAGKAGLQAAGRKAVSALPQVDPETLQLAREAHSMGFRLRPDQIYGNKFGSIAGELSSNVPFSGAPREHNQNVFNQRLVESIGGTGDKLTRKTFNDAMKQSGETIGNIAGSKSVPFDEALVNKLTNHVAEAQQYETGDVEKVVRNVVNQITDKSQNGVLDGQTFRKLNTDLNTRIRNSQNGDLRNALSGIQDDLQEHFVSTLTPDELQQYNAARRQYAIGKTLEPLVAKAPTGNISSSQLLGAITRTQAGKSAVARGAAGDLGKLADIGQRFLKEPASSGTAERSMVQRATPAAVGAGGAIGATSGGVPAALGAGAAYGAANLYNRFGPDVTNLLLNRPPQ